MLKVAPHVVRYAIIGVQELRAGEGDGVVPSHGHQLWQSGLQIVLGSDTNLAADNWS
jgi:hypothetical protein